MPSGHLFHLRPHFRGWCEGRVHDPPPWLGQLGRRRAVSESCFPLLVPPEPGPNVRGSRAHGACPRCVPRPSALVTAGSPCLPTSCRPNSETGQFEAIFCEDIPDSGKGRVWVTRALAAQAGPQHSCRNQGRSEAAGLRLSCPDRKLRPTLVSAQALRGGDGDVADVPPWSWAQS